MTTYENVNKEVMEELDEAEKEGNRKKYEEIKQKHGIVDFYDLIKERNEI